MRPSSGLLVAAALLAGPLQAAEVQVRVADAAGAQVGDAVVMLEPLPGTIAAEPPPASRIVDQVDETFVPLVQVFRPGDSVVFRNSDVTRHHAYSFSPVRPFEMELQPGETSAPLLLDRSGIVSVGCNIHDRMITYLYVADAPFVARSGNDGLASLPGVPAGSYRMSVWHPRLRDREAPAVQQLDVSAGHSGQPVAVTLPLLPERHSGSDPERVDY